jgi:protein involved in polysaccharide export with SLBB domain
MQNDADMTVLKAISMSEGLQPYSAKLAYIYRSQAGEQQRHELMVPLGRIMQRKDADVALMRDDILYIPENGAKKMTSKVLGQISGFAQTTGSGILILH